MSKIDDELIEGCNRFLNEMKRVEREKERKKEEEKQKQARRDFWSKMLHLDERQGITFIVPGNSKLKK